MSDNDRILLTQLIDDRKAKEAEDMEDSDYFEYFTAHEYLKDYDLDTEELQAGIVAGGQDGGIDGLYVFVNGALVGDDYDPTSAKRNIQLELVMIQAKRSKGFQEEPLNKLTAACSDLLDLSKSPTELRKTYNGDVVSAIQRFRDAHATLVGRFPELRFRFAYVSVGDSPEPGVRRKVRQLDLEVKRHYRDADVKFEFVGATSLLELARREPKTSFELRFVEQTISAKGPQEHLCLANLKEYYGLICDESGNLLIRLFDANVRDYQSQAEVNRGIRQSLEADTPEDFWWLNNGVSILGSKASVSGKVITIEDPQIVNGFQTSREIYNYFTKNPDASDDRNLLVRVIVPSSEDVRDRIIKATNSQTPIPHASLRATDPVHRNIEDHLKRAGIFYDRKKGQYRNLGKPLKSIVSISYVAQAVLSIALHRPDSARARPSSLLKSDETYERIFSDGYPLAMYEKCVKVMRLVEEHLKQEVLAISRNDQANVRFYVAMHVAYVARAQNSPGPAAYAKLKESSITDELLTKSRKSVMSMYKRLGGNDKVAKGPELSKRVLTSAKRRLTNA